MELVATKICHVCSAHTDDDPRVFHRTCVSLAASGYDVHLVATSDRTETYTKKGVTLHPLPLTQRRAERLTRRYRVAEIAAKIGPALFHVHEPELLGPVIVRAGNRPVIWDVHESYLDVLTERKWLPEWLKPLARFAWDREERRLLPHCASVVVVTPQYAQRYRPLHDRVEVVSNFPDLSAVEALPPASPERRQACVFAGILYWNRGLSQVVEALAILRKRGLSVPLELAGPSSPANYLEGLMAEAERLGVKDLVTYHGILPKSETYAFQQQATIGLCPNLPYGNSIKGLANKLAECMALGLPVVYSDFPGYREVASECGAGIAVDPTQPEQIADAIERLIGNPELARQMGEAGRRATRERYNWNAELQKLLRLYEEILGPRKRANGAMPASRSSEAPSGLSLHEAGGARN